MDYWYFVHPVKTNYNIFQKHFALHLQESRVRVYALSLSLYDRFLMLSIWSFLMTLPSHKGTASIHSHDGVPHAHDSSFWVIYWVWLLLCSAWYFPCLCLALFMSLSYTAWDDPKLQILYQLLYLLWLQNRHFSNWVSGVVVIAIIEGPVPWHREHIIIYKLKQ